MYINTFHLYGIPHSFYLSTVLWHYQFSYDEEKDVYICPENQTLTKIGEKTDSNGDKAYIYVNRSACKNCPNRSKCTKPKYRVLCRKSFQSEVDKLDKRLIKLKGVYKKDKKSSNTNSWRQNGCRDLIDITQKALNQQPQRMPLDSLRTICAEQLILSVQKSW